MGRFLRQESTLDLGRSVLVGDSETDVAAGQAAGVPVTILIESDSDLRAALERIPDAGS